MGCRDKAFSQKLTKDAVKLIEGAFRVKSEKRVFPPQFHETDRQPAGFSGDFFRIFLPERVKDGKAQQ